MDKKQVTDLRSELLDSRFGAKSISTIAESKRFPLHEMRDDVAFQIINDELYLDGNARQNLATFCQTWDDENVHKLMDLSINKNWIDKEEYPQSAAIDLRCVNMVADLWHAPAPKNGQAVGTNTIGSSEACMLPGLRNVALTAPYFHRGDVPTLDGAVKLMLRYQVGKELPQEDVDDIVAFLHSLNGVYTPYMQDKQ
ncbi:hypothetical protein GUC69_14005 [Escherichia coli]|nr:hypothetical protein [Escherichia coli]